MQVYVTMPEEIRLNDLVITKQDNLVKPDEIGKVKNTLAAQEYANTINQFIDNRINEDPTAKGHLDEIASAEYSNAGLLQAAKTLDAEKRAQIDEMTGLIKKVGFLARITEEISRISRLGVGLIDVFTIDLDGFKNINDTYGHGTGDKAIQKIAEILKISVRPYDIVSRLGGDEFGILVMNGEEKNAETIATRIRNKLEEYKTELEGLDLLSASIGVATYSAVNPNISAEDLLERSDTAMYRAKEQKGTHIVHWEENITKPPDVTSRI